MSVICQLCNQVFDKQITNRHLKYKHNITTTEYKNQFGKYSLTSEEYRAAKSQQLSGTNNPMFGKTHTTDTKKRISTRKKGQSAHNLGRKMTDEQKQLLSSKARERMQKYKQTQTHPRLGKPVKAETKNKISQSLAGRVSATIESKQKSKATKILNGTYGLAPMHGKKHSDATKKKIQASLLNLAKTKHQTTYEKIINLLSSINISVVQFDQHNQYMLLECQTCNNQFEFTKQYTTPSKFRKDLCPYCRQSVAHSAAEYQILDFIKSLLPKQTILSGNRSKIYPLELDIYIPDLNIAVEYCGLYWHSELNGKDSKYHLHKLQKCQEQGIKLITIFEDEWINHSHLVKSRLKNLLGKTTNKISARSCTVVTLDSHSANQFCKNNHIQGSGRTNHAQGLVYQQQLVAVMTFSKPSVAKGAAKHDFELNRFCCSIDTVVIGAASRLFAALIKELDPNSVISYSDLRWNSGKVYEILGFDLDGQISPNYWYINFAQCKRIHRYALRKNTSDDKNLTEWQNRQLQGYDRIWDCGNLRYIWTKK